MPMRKRSPPTTSSRGARSTSRAPATGGSETNRCSPPGDGVTTAGFEGEEDGVTMDGDVTTGLVGFDAEWERTLAGVMLARSAGDGTYRDGNGPVNDTGTVKSSLTGIYPYVQIDLNARVSAWALAGAGSGELTLRQNGGEPMPADISMRMGAVGFKSEMLDGAGAGKLAINLKSDAMWVGTKSERTNDMVATEGDVTRLRLIVEGERAFDMSGGATFTPSAQMGLRHDGGDAETGIGIELGAGLRYSVDRVTVEAEAHTLVTHEDSAYKEWGASAALRITPRRVRTRTDVEHRTAVGPAQGAPHSGCGQSGTRAHWGRTMRSRPTVGSRSTQATDSHWCTGTACSRHTRG